MRLLILFITSLFFGILMYSYNCIANDITDIHQQNMWHISQSKLKSIVTTLSSQKYKGRKAGSTENKLIEQILVNEFLKMNLNTLPKLISKENDIKTQNKIDQKNYRQNIISQISGNIIGTNLLAVIGPTNHNSKCILIGAHYDGQGIHDDQVLPSADDNASGVATVLEIAKNLKQHEEQLKKCVIIALWDHEEGSLKTFGGIKGSKFWVENPTFDLNRIELTITFDLIGGNLFKSGAEDLFFALGTQSAPFLNYDTHEDLQIAKFNYDVIEPLGAKTARSDYTHFRLRNIPSIFLTTGTPWYYHKPEDTVDKINFLKQIKITRYTLNLIWSLLTRDEKVVSIAHKFQIPAWEETHDMKNVLGILLSDQSNFIKSDLIYRVQEDYLLLQRRINQGQPAQLCERRRAFFNLLEAVGGLTSTSSLLGRALSHCSYRD